MSTPSDPFIPAHRQDGFLSGMPHRLALAGFPFMLLIVAHVITLYRHGGMVFKGNLLGPDAYMRLVRVSEWVAGNSWYDQASLRSNAPFGEILHWSRPLDLILAAGALVGSLFTDFETALFWWGAFFNPVLHILALILLLWAAEPLFPAFGRVYLGLLAMVQFALTAQFSIGRPDHHGLLAAVFIALLAITLRLLSDKENRRLCIAAGCLMAFAIWVSIEGLFSAGILYAALGLCWIILGRDFAVKLFIISLTTFIVLGIALLIEYRPSELLTPIYDALSIVHLLLFALLTLFWAVTAFLIDAKRPFPRLGLSVIGGGISMLIVYGFYPKFFAGPMVDVHPRVIAEWFHNNQEVMPMFGKVQLGVALQSFFGHLGATVPAAIYAIILIRKSEGIDRRRWVYLLAGLLLCVAMTLHERRWAADAQIYMLFPYTALLLTVLDRLREMSLLKRAMLRATAVILFAITPIYLAGLTNKVTAPLKFPERGCDLRGITAFLKDRYDAKSKIIMTYIFVGPELIYRSNHKVIPSPYHRNTNGMLDFYDFFRTKDINVAKEIADKRKIELVLLCPRYIESYSLRVAKGEQNLYQHLVKGTAPQWLRRIKVPTALADNFILYETKL